MISTEAALRTALADADRDITMIGKPRHVRGYANELWFFDSSDGPVVAKVRIIPEEDPEQTLTYLRSMQRLRDARYPTPELLLFDAAATGLGGRQLSVLRHSPGLVGSHALPRLTASERGNLFRDLGRAVGRLHGIDLPPGTVWRDDTGAPHPAWPAVVQSSLDEARAELAGLVGESRRLVDTASARIAAAAPDLLSSVTVPRLVHRDLHPGNLLVETDQIVAVLDFEMVREWDPAYDFVKITNTVLAVHSDAEKPFLAGYREQAPIGDEFEVRVDLYRGLYHVLSAAEHLAGNPGHRHWQDRLRSWLHGC